MSRNDRILGKLSQLHKESEPQSIRFTATEPFYVHVEDELLESELDDLRTELAELKGRVRGRIAELKDLSP
jgi:hypothetical protein